MSAPSQTRRGLCNAIIVGVLMITTTAAGLAIVLPAMAAEQSNAARYKTVVDGLACPFCGCGIEKKLNESDGVRAIHTYIASEAVTVTMTPGNTLDNATAARAVMAAGFNRRDRM